MQPEILNHRLLRLNSGICAGAVKIAPAIHNKNQDIPNMCDLCTTRGKGWLGWIETPSPQPSTGSGAWHDLSYAVSSDMPCASIFPKPSFGLLRSMPKDPINVTDIHMPVHAGTHVDSPRHYYLDGPAFEDIPLDRLHGPGVVWQIHKKPDEIIERDELERATPKLRPGDILAIDTGWTEQFCTEAYEHHPSLTAEAAMWLVEQKIKLFACDFATPDLPYHLRQEGFDWPVHRALLSRGILICEHLRGHAPLAGKRVEFIFAALNITGSDGAPARVLARPAES